MANSSLLYSTQLLAFYKKMRYKDYLIFMALKNEHKNEEKRQLRSKMKANILSGACTSSSNLRGSKLYSIVMESASIFAFVSMSDEPDTSPIFELALEGGKTLGLPRVNGKSLDFLSFDGNRENLKASALGPLEPTCGNLLFSSSINEGANNAFSFPLLILVPGLAFSKKGERLGRGAGFYDRFLHEFSARYDKAKFTVAGFCFTCQIIDSLPVESFDFTMDCIALPDGSIIKI